MPRPAGTFHPIDHAGRLPAERAFNTASRERGASLPVIATGKQAISAEAAVRYVVVSSGIEMLLTCFILYLGNHSMNLSEIPSPAVGKPAAWAAAQWK
jgi:hypothetical protein